jgi:hypothetical protein
VRVSLWDGIVQSRAVNLAYTARLISGVTRLPLLAVPLFLLIGAATAGWGGFLWALLCLFLTSGLSLLYLSYLVRVGKVSDAGRILKGERVKPLWVVAMLHTGAWLVVTFLGAPAPLRAILLSYALSTLAFAILTPFTKISLHTAGVSGALACLLFVFGAWASSFFVPVLALVWWARHFLERHTHPELALGAVVGGGLTWAALRLVA